MKNYRWLVFALGATIVGIVLTPHALRAGGDDAFDVFLVSVQVQETKADGSAWDPGGGKPDLRVVITNERSGKTFISEVAKDTYSVKFDSGRRALGVSEGDILDVLVFDEDLVDHDIVGISRKAITPSFLAAGQLDLSFDRVEQFRLEFRPHK